MWISKEEYNKLKEENERQKNIIEGVLKSIEFYREIVEEITVVDGEYRLIHKSLKSLLMTGFDRMVDKISTKPLFDIYSRKAGR